MEPLCDHAAATTERMKSRTQGAGSGTVAFASISSPEKEAKDLDARHAFFLAFAKCLR
jgi:hypothetical protein